MNFKLALDKNKTYVLACSYGPDSMFLFNALYREGYKFVVAHVNYHKRKESNGEQSSLEQYSKERNIPIEVLDTTGMKCSGNFQAWARKIRYEFFKKVCEKYHTNLLLVAHHQDDLLETYLMQKKRGGFYSYYGIKEKAEYNGMTIIRPMLNLSKKDIVEFDDKNNVPYSIDSSNLTDAYERNKVRHWFLPPLTLDEITKIMEEIKRRNKEIKELDSFASLSLYDGEYLKVEDAKKMSLEQFSYTLFRMMEHSAEYYPLSTKFISELMGAFDSKKANIKIKLFNDIYYYQEYGEIRVVRDKVPYSYTLKKPEIFECEEFFIDLSRYGIDRNIKPEDFPITIRCPKDSDEYQIGNYSKKVNRLFIDWKMPLHLRAVWPIIVNKDDKIIYIPRYRKEYVDKHETVFKISLK